MDGERLKFKVKESGLTISEITTRMGFNHTGHISALFTRKGIRTDTLEKLAEVMERPISWFYEEYPTINKEEYKRLITLQGYTFKDMANGMGISPTAFINRIDPIVPYYILEKSAAVMGLPIEYFWGEDLSGASDKELIKQLKQSIASQTQVIAEQAKALQEMHILFEMAINKFKEFDTRLDIITQKIIEEKIKIAK